MDDPLHLEEFAAAGFTQCRMLLPALPHDQVAAWLPCFQQGFAVRSAAVRLTLSSRGGWRTDMLGRLT
jgi:hypothetical protein